MRVIACLFWLISISRSTDPVGEDPVGETSNTSIPFGNDYESMSTLEMMEVGSKSMIWYLKNSIRESVLSGDGLSLSEDVDLGVLEALCNPAETVMVGKSCRKEFSRLGDCSDTPCRILDWAKNQAPAALSRFLAAETYEEMYRVVAREGIVPVWRLLCECPGVVTASINCVKKYDGALLDLVEEADRTAFEEVVKRVDWKAARSVIQGVLSSGCGEVDGLDCLDELAELMAAGNGRVIDNTFQGEEGCLSLKRVEEELTDVYMSLVHETDAKNVEAYIEACLKLWDALMCDNKCSSEMQDTFYPSCCVKRAGEQFNSQKMRKNVTRLLKSVWSFLSDGEMPNLTVVVNQYLSMFEPAAFCGDKTSVYRDFNEQCEAIGA